MNMSAEKKTILSDLQWEIQSILYKLYACIYLETSNDWTAMHLKKNETQCKQLLSIFSTYMKNVCLETFNLSPLHLIHTYRSFQRNRPVMNGHPYFSFVSFFVSTQHNTTVHTCYVAYTHITWLVCFFGRDRHSFLLVNINWFYTITILIYTIVACDAIGFRCGKTVCRMGKKVCSFVYECELEGE